MNISNTVTLCRILLVFPLYFSIEIDNNIITAMIFLLAASTDYIDGYLARKFDQRTIVGSFLDPIADKILISCSLIILYGLDRVELYMVLLFIVFEFLGTGLREFMARLDKVDRVSPNWVGERKIDFQFLSIFLLFLDQSHIGSILLYIALMFTFGSAFSKFQASKIYLKK